MKWTIVFLFIEIGQIYETGLVYRDLGECQLSASVLRHKINDRNDRPFLDDYVDKKIVCVPKK